MSKEKEAQRIKDGAKLNAKIGLIFPFKDYSVMNHLERKIS